MGLLSSAAYTSVMTFGFPAQVGRDLLQALRGFRVADLLPLGRDQVGSCSVEGYRTLAYIGTSCLNASRLPIH
jgi:hypothetical protein